MITGGAHRAFAAISFPPTTFAILNPDTGAVIGQSSYSVEGTVDGGQAAGNKPPQMYRQGQPMRD